MLALLKDSAVIIRSPKVAANRERSSYCSCQDQGWSCASIFLIPPSFFFTLEAAQKMKGDPIINLFPNLVFKLIRSPNLNSNQLAFRVHKSVNKFEIKGYSSFQSSFQSSFHSSFSFSLFFVARKHILIVQSSRVVMVDTWRRCMAFRSWM